MPKLNLDADARKGVKAFADLDTAIKKTEKSLDKTEDAASKLERAAGRIARANEGPQERYNRKMAELARLVNAGKLSLDQAQAAAVRYQKQLDRAQQSGHKAFGNTALASLKSYAQGFFGVATAVNLVTQALREQAAERQRAVEGSKGAVVGEAALAQLAVTQGDTLESRRAAHQVLLRESRRQFGRGAGANRDEVGQELFKFVSAGLNEDDRNLGFDIKRANVIGNVGDAATAFAALTKSLGAKEVGSFDDFLDQALAASEIAPAQANEIPLAAARAGGSAKALKLTDEFIIASTALLAGATGSASEGGTQLSALLKQIEKAAPGNELLKGKSGIDLIKAIASLPEAQQGIGGILGDRAEAITGFRTLRDNLPALEAQLGKQRAAQADNLAQQSISVALSDPNTLAAILEREAGNKTELSNLDSATNNLLTKAALDERARVRRGRARDGDALDRSAAEASIFVEGTQINLETLFGLRDAADYKRQAQAELLEEGDIRNPELIEALRDNTRALRGRSTTTKQE